MNPRLDGNGQPMTPTKDQVSGQFHRAATMSPLGGLSRSRVVPGAGFAGPGEGPEMAWRDV
jgi:hypothetical protein